VVIAAAVAGEALSNHWGARKIAHAIAGSNAATQAIL
jgi:hypothetical protein